MIERRDRPKDPHGGVIIAAKRDLLLGSVYKSPEVELISGTIKLDDKKP